MRKLISLLCAVLLLTPLRVSAAEPLSFTPPYFAKNWSGQSGEFTIPYSAYYKLTLSGAQGSSYGGGEGGYGIVQTKTLWLKEGTKVKFECGNVGVRTIASGVMSIAGGSSSKLWFDGVLQAQSSGGQSVCNSEIAPTGVAQVRLYSGGNDRVVTYPVHWHTGSATDGSGCYFKEECWYSYFKPAWHDCPVDSHHNDSDYDNGHHGCYMYCTECGDSSPLGQMPECHTGCWTTGIFYKYHGVGDPPVAGASNGSNHKYFLGCGYEDGQIVGVSSQSLGTSVNRWQADSSEQSNTGAGKFSIQLIEQDRLKYTSTVNKVSYLNNGVGLVIYEDTRRNERFAVYVKHGRP